MTQAMLGKILVSAVQNYDGGGAVLNIPAKTLVLDVFVVITTAFVGTSPTVDVGDGDNDDGWVDNGDVTEGTIGSYYGTTGNGAAYSVTGKYYQSADTIDALIGGSDLSAGQFVVVARVVELDDLV